LQRRAEKAAGDQSKNGVDDRGLSQAAGEAAELEGTGPKNTWSSVARELSDDRAPGIVPERHGKDPVVVDMQPAPMDGPDPDRVAAGMQKEKYFDGIAHPPEGSPHPEFPELTRVDGGYLGPIKSFPGDAVVTASGPEVEKLRRALKLKFRMLGHRGVNDLSNRCQVPGKKLLEFAAGDGELSQAEFDAVMAVIRESEGV
jgi:hypothetical protein